jgi:predicted ATP-grasp superfamily ATP-dependent carboligase
VIVGVSTRALAESARHAGFTAASVDAFGDLDQKQYVESLGIRRDLGRAYSAAAAAAAARRFAAPAAAYVGNLENHPTAVRRLAEGRRLLGNSPATLVRARDFRELAAVVRAAGGRVPTTLLPAEARNLASGGSWLRKPLRGGGGSGVREWKRGAPLRAGELVQERIDGVLASLSFVADGRRAVLLGLCQGLFGDAAFGARLYRYSGSLYPFPADGSLLARLDAIAQTATRAFGLVGLNGVDFVVRDGEAFVLELNPRYCASMELVERSRGLSVFAVHDAACGGTLPTPPPLARGPTEEVLGKAVLWARRDIVAGNTRALLDRDDVRDLPFPGERIGRSHPTCTVFARGADRKACYAALVAAGAAVEKMIAGDV